MSVLRIYPKPTLEDSVLEELLSTIPDSKFYNKTKVMVPFSSNPTIFVVETSSYDKPILIKVNGAEQFRGSPSAPIRNVINPLRIRFSVLDTSFLPNLDVQPDLTSGDLAVVEKEFVSAEGKVRWQKNSSMLEGFSTSFQDVLVPGMSVRPVGGNRWYKVATVHSNNSVSLTSVFLDSTILNGTLEFQTDTPRSYIWSGTKWQPTETYRGAVVLRQNENDVNDFHVEMEVPLKLANGKNQIEVSILGTSDYASLDVTATSWLTLQMSYARTLFKHIVQPLDQETAALQSPWSPRFIEHLLNYRDTLPDLKNPHIHAVKLAVRASMVSGGTDGGVRAFAAALTYNNPIVKRISNRDFLRVGARLFRRQDEKYGNRFHVWFPSLSLARWLAFAKLAENVPSVMKLESYTDNEIDVFVEGLTQRLEQHRSEIGPSFKEITDAMPRLSVSVFIQRSVTIPVKANFYNYGLNNAVQVPFGAKVSNGSHVGSAYSLASRSDGIDYADGRGFNWFLEPLTSTRFASNSQAHPRPASLNSMSGIQREVAPPQALTSVSVTVEESTPTFVRLKVFAEPAYGCAFYNFDFGDGRFATQRENSIVITYEGQTQPVTYTIKVAPLDSSMVPGPSVSTTYLVPAVP